MARQEKARMQKLTYVQNQFNQLTYDQVILGLIENSLDARSTKISMDIQFSTNSILIKDDGAGVIFSNMKEIGKQFYSNKYLPDNTLSENVFIGCYGVFLHYVTIQSKEVHVISRAAKGIWKTIIDPSSQLNKVTKEKQMKLDKGTIIYINELHLPPSSSYEKLTHLLTKIKNLLTNSPHVIFHLRDMDNRYNLLQVSTHKDFFQRYNEICTPSFLINGELIYSSFDNNKIKVNVILSKMYHHTRDLQFVYVNNRLIQYGILYSLFNKILKKSYICRYRKFNIIQPEKMNGIYFINIYMNRGDFLAAYDVKNNNIKLDPDNSIVKFLIEEFYLVIYKENLISDYNEVYIVQTILNKLKKYYKPPSESMINLSPPLEQEQENMEIELPDIKPKVENILDIIPVASTSNTNTIYDKESILIRDNEIKIESYPLKVEIEEKEVEEVVEVVEDKKELKSIITINENNSNLEPFIITKHKLDHQHNIKINYKLPAGCVVNTELYNKNNECIENNNELMKYLCQSSIVTKNSVIQSRKRKRNSNNQLDCPPMKVLFHLNKESNIFFKWPTNDGNYVDFRGNPIKFPPKNNNINMINITNTMLEQAIIIGQYDKKFILIEIEKVIIAVDQHGAHERIVYDQKLQELRPNLWTEKPVLKRKYMNLSPNQYYNVKHYPYWFRMLGLRYTINDSSLGMELQGIPKCFFNKNTLIKNFQESILTLIDQSEPFLKNRQVYISNINLPILMSRVVQLSCKEAYKIGQQLTKVKCRNLINDLSQLKMIFLYADGRPNLIPLLKMKQIKCLKNPLE